MKNILPNSTKNQIEFAKLFRQLFGDEPEQKPKPIKYVYLVQSGDKYKIGKTKDVKTRLSSLQTSSAEPIILVHAIASRDVHSLEKELHELFKDKLVRGEWYALDDEDVKLIKQMPLSEFSKAHMRNPYLHLLDMLSEDRYRIVKDVFAWTYSTEVIESSKPNDVHPILHQQMIAKAKAHRHEIEQRLNRLRLP